MTLAKGARCHREQLTSMSLSPKQKDPVWHRLGRRETETPHAALGLRRVGLGQCGDAKPRHPQVRKAGAHFLSVSSFPASAVRLSLPLKPSHDNERRSSRRRGNAAEGQVRAHRAHGSPPPSLPSPGEQERGGEALGGEASASRPCAERPASAHLASAPLPAKWPTSLLSALTPEGTLLLLTT